MIMAHLMALMTIGLPMQSGEGGAPSDIIEATGDAVAKIPTAVIVLLAVMILSGVVLLALKMRGGPQ